MAVEALGAYGTQPPQKAPALGVVADACGHALYGICANATDGTSIPSTTAKRS